MQVGPQIRAARSERGWSLRHLAGRAQVSPSLLSEVERGSANPSITTLFQIAGALELPVQTLLPPAPVKAAAPSLSSPVSIVRQAERPHIKLDGNIAWERLAPHADGEVECLELIYAPGATSGETMFHHAGREWGVVLAGELTLDLAFARHTLRTGDSVSFVSSTPHRLSNLGSETLRLLWNTINYSTPATVPA